MAMTMPRQAVGHVAFRGAGLLAGIFLAACASDLRHALDQPKVVRGEDIAAYAMHEQCMHLAVGDRLHYDFTANEPVDFNIHYHEGRAVIAPIVRDKAQQDSGVFAPIIARDYCLMWEAGPAGALLDYRISLRPAAR
jgi:hypothetical protein